MNALEHSCSHLAELVTDFLEQALDPQTQLSFETHVVYCPGCHAFLDQVRETVACLHALPAEPVDEAERALLLEAYESRK